MEIKEVTKVFTRHVYAKCSFCGKGSSIWDSDILGSRAECNFCGEIFNISKHADIVLESPIEYDMEQTNGM